MTQRWVCESCGVAAEVDGSCEACEGERIDAESAAGREALEARAIAERRAHASKLTTYSLPLGLLAGLGLGTVLPPLPVPGGQPVVALVLAVVAAALVREGLGTVWKGPERFAPFAPSPKRRTGPRLALAALAVLAIGASVYGWRTQVAAERAEAEAEAAGRAWANVWQCAVGGPAGDREVTARARLIQLEGSAEGWPDRCSPYVQTLYDLARDGRFGAELPQALTNRFECDAQCRVTDPSRQLVGLLDLGASLPRVAPNAAAPPALDARPYPQASFLPLGGAFDAERRGRDLRADGRVRLHLESASRGHQLCDLALARGTVDCASVEVGSPRPDRLALLRTPAPTFAATRGDETQIITPDGEVLDHVAGRHEGFVLAKREGDLVALRVKDGARDASADLELEDASAWIEADHLLWTNPADGGVRISAQALRRKGELLGEAVDVGVIPDGTRLARCTAGATDHWLFGDRPDRFAIVTHDPDRGWSLRRPESQPEDAKPKEAPVAAPSPAASSAGGFGVVGLLEGQDALPESGFAALPEASARNPFTPPPATTEVALPFAAAQPRRSPYTLSCRPGGAEVTWRQAEESADRIVQLRCGAEGCGRNEVTLTGLDVDAWWLATALGPDQTLIVWRRRAGDLRMRLAPLAELADAKGEMLVDAAAHGGPETRALDAFVGPTGVAFLFDGKGVHGIFVDAAGHRRPLGTDEDLTGKAQAPKPAPGPPRYHQHGAPGMP